VLTTGGVRHAGVGVLQVVIEHLLAVTHGDGVCATGPGVALERWPDKPTNRVTISHGSTGVRTLGTREYTEESAVVR